MVVDDTKLNLIVAKGLLKVTNANVETCLSGKECLALIAKKHYDIVLLDIMMPDMDGVETLREIRQLENNPCSDSVYIALTANAMQDSRESYLKDGFDDYISKPITPDLFEATLEKYIKKS